MLQEGEAQGFVSHGIPMDPTGGSLSGTKRGLRAILKGTFSETMILVMPESLLN